MLGQKQNDKLFFQNLCEEYYEKILRYTYNMLGNEAAARDCTQEVFLLACQKLSLIYNHPNPGGFLFQTAKNLNKKFWRESFQRMALDNSLEELKTDPEDSGAEILKMLDSKIDETGYIETVLSGLTNEKRQLYSLYYMEHKSMAEIAAIYSLEETAVRMRYVRLRREIIAIVAEVSEQNFIL